MRAADSSSVGTAVLSRGNIFKPGKCRRQISEEFGVDIRVFSRFGEEKMESSLGRYSMWYDQRVVTPLEILSLTVESHGCHAGLLLVIKASSQSMIPFR